MRFVYEKDVFWDSVYTENIESFVGTGDATLDRFKDI